MAKHVFYIPGLGDHIPHGQRVITQLWRLYGLKVHYFNLGWANGEVFEPKLQRLLAKIDELQAAGHNVSIVGISAGASAAINAYGQRPELSSLVLICGKVTGSGDVNPRYYKENPAFEQSLKLSEKVVGKLTPGQARRILSLYCRLDRTVVNRYSQILGAKNQTIAGLGHISAIYLAITLGSWRPTAFIKKH